MKRRIPDQKMKNIKNTERRGFFGLLGAAAVSVFAFKFIPFSKSTTTKVEEEVSGSRNSSVKLHPMAVKRSAKGGINE